MKNRQTSFFKSAVKEFGGDLLKKRKARLEKRPLVTKETMHLVLRSTQATGAQSFRQPHHARKIRDIIGRFSTKYGVRIYSCANVGNHLHLHVKLNNRYTYYPFIRALTAAIAVAIVGNNRWTGRRIKFWDRRPFTRVLQGFRSFLNLRDYIRINQLEGGGHSRVMARLIVGTEGRGDSG